MILNSLLVVADYFFFTTLLTLSQDRSDCPRRVLRSLEAICVLGVRYNLIVGYERRFLLSKGNCFRSTERAIVIKLLPTQLK